MASSLGRLCVAPCVGMVAIGIGVCAFGQPGERISAPRSLETIRVDIRLRTGGSMIGLVLDHDENGLALLSDDTPYAFAWRELQAQCAYDVMRLLILSRGGQENGLSADQWLKLGAFALAQDDAKLASEAFYEAIRIDGRYKERARAAALAVRQRRKASGEVFEVAGPETMPLPASLSAEEVVPSEALPPISLLSEDAACAVKDAYQEFGAAVRSVLGAEIEAVETEHFLIWTDWPAPRRGDLALWCERMYAALCRHFLLDETIAVFPAKCPVFCFQRRASYLRFARQFDSYDGRDSLGYTRSIERHGHVHVAVLRDGSQPADFDRFATTLVHEGTHAFLHRLYAPRLIPHWVNEGLADLIAERVLGDRCPTGENAGMMARQYVRFDWPIRPLLEWDGPIAVHQYPLAHSLVGYLVHTNENAFRAFIRKLKEGLSVAEALAESYNGMTPAELDASWRNWVRARENL